MSSFVVFVVLKKRCKLPDFSTIIFAVFLYDLAYASYITSKWLHSRQSYDVILIFIMAAIELEI